MATWRQTLINQSLAAIRELTKKVQLATEHGEDTYSTRRFAEEIEGIAKDQLSGWSEQIPKEDE